MAPTRPPPPLPEQVEPEPEWLCAWRASNLAEEQTLDWETCLQQVRFQVAQTHQQTLLQAAAVGTQTIRLKKEWAKVFASVAGVWLHVAASDPLENRIRATCRRCKRFSSIVINVTTIAFNHMGQFVSGPHGNMGQRNANCVQSHGSESSLTMVSWAYQRGDQIRPGRWQGKAGRKARWQGRPGKRAKACSKADASIQKQPQEQPDPLQQAADPRAPQGPTSTGFQEPRPVRRRCSAPAPFALCQWPDADQGLPKKS